MRTRTSAKDTTLDQISENVRCRSTCDPKLLVRVNKNLSTLQRSKIGNTPFKWLMQMPDKLNMSGNLLRELASRWDERGGGFRVRSRVVPFTPLDVCLSLGLRIVGDKVRFDEVGDSYTKGLFGGQKITAATVYEKLTELQSDEHVDDFCRLYMLLGLVEFYFPKTSPTISDSFMKILDDLQSVDKYSWGVAVFDNLVCTLTCTRGRLSEAKNSHQIHITGCTPVLEIWAVDHLSLRGKKTMMGVTSFPRFLILANSGIRGRQVDAAFENNGVLHDLATTNEELEHEVVREAMSQAGSGFYHWRHNVYDIITLHEEHQHLLAQNKDLERRISKLEEEFKTLKQSKPSDGVIYFRMVEPEQKDEGQLECHDNVVDGTSDAVWSPCVVADKGIESKLEKQKKDEVSNMITRLKVKLRKRVVSGKVSSPWTPYQRRRKKKEGLLQK
ncbi:Aminotransferase-like, plant mobile domain [Sesbania bispinosa]|nr:Aminotransferase-like, plant mobile domain [Sesbania bispinosa]